MDAIDARDIEVRGIRDDEFAAWFATEALGFGNQPPSPAELAAELTTAELDRWLAAFDGDLIVGTAGAYSFDLTLPGGAAVPAAGVTGVTVLPTHRRRGILTEMMGVQLEDCADRGEPVAILNASEAAIYRRFGYGVGTLYRTLRVDKRRVAFAEPTPPRRLRVLSRAEAAEVLPGVHDAYRRSRPGSVTQRPSWWAAVLGERRCWKGGGEIFVVVAEPAGDDPGGFAIWTVDVRTGTLGLRELIAATPATQAALWRFVCEIDLVTTIDAEAVSVDDPLRWLLTDLRAAHVTEERDYLWVRLLDVAAALSARRYPVEDELVLEVTDSFRPATAGRYALRGGPGAASCARTDEPADLSLDVADLGSLLLGGVPARDLAAVGRITARTPGAVERATALFGWPVAPFCITKF